MGRASGDPRLLSIHLISKKSTKYIEKHPDNKFNEVKKCGTDCLIISFVKTVCYNILAN